MPVARGWLGRGVAALLLVSAAGVPALAAVDAQATDRAVSGRVRVADDFAPSGGAVQVVGYVGEEQANFCGSLDIESGGRFAGMIDETSCTSGAGDEFRYRFRYVSGDLETIAWLTPDVPRGGVLEGLALVAPVLRDPQAAPQGQEALPRVGDGTMARDGGGTPLGAMLAASGLAAVAAGAALVARRPRGPRARLG